MRIALIGDSTLMWMRPNRNHQNQLTIVELLILNNDVEVDVFAQPGMTSHNALTLVWNKLMGRFYDYYIFSFGINDCIPRSFPRSLANFHNNTLIAQTKYDHLRYFIYRFLTSIKIQKFFAKVGLSKPWANIIKFEENATEIINILLKESDSRLIFLTIPKTSRRVEDIFPEINLTINKFSSVIKSLGQNNVNVMDINHVFEKDYEKLIPEGIHYSSDAHQLVYTQLLEFLEKNN